MPRANAARTSWQLALPGPSTVHTRIPVTDAPVTDSKKWKLYSQQLDPHAYITVNIHTAQFQYRPKRCNKVMGFKKVTLSCDRVPILTLLVSAPEHWFLMSPLSASLSGAEIRTERAKNQVSGSGAVSGRARQNTVEREAAERCAGVIEIGMTTRWRAYVNSFLF